MAGAVTRTSFSAIRTSERFPTGGDISWWHREGLGQLLQIQIPTRGLSGDQRQGSANRTKKGLRTLREPQPQQSVIPPSLQTIRIHLARTSRATRVRGRNVRQMMSRSQFTW